MDIVQYLDEKMGHAQALRQGANCAPLSPEGRRGTLHPTQLPKSLDEVSPPPPPNITPGTTGFFDFIYVKNCGFCFISLNLITNWETTGQEGII